MSYDVYLRSEPCPHCQRKGYEPDLPDPTYNLTPIFDLALTGEPMPNTDVGEGAVVLLGAKTDRPRGLRILDGRKASDTAKQLSAAMHRLEDPDMRARFVALEPTNKWGTLPDALSVMRRLREAAVEFPDNVWEVH